MATLPAPRRRRGSPGYDQLVIEIAADLRRWLLRGERVAIATVVSTRRSAPRPIGAKLAVSEGGELAGSVSGGCVENEVYGLAQEALAGGPPTLASYGISDELGLSVGLPCGGEIDVFVDEYAPDLVERLLVAAEQEEPAVLYEVVAGEELGAKLLAFEHGEVMGNDLGEAPATVDELLRRGLSTLVEDDTRTVFCDVLGRRPRLVVFGAVDTAEHLCRSARGLGWRTTVVDARPKLATVDRIPSADELIVAWPEEALQRIAPDHATSIVVLTHEDRFDIPALKGALATDAPYIGALGSRQNQERRRERLLAEGVHEGQLERISGPSGLDIGASTPAETAISILAEILSVRAGRDGGRLKVASGRIHAESSP
jgi:xanthine dehydrogenase accessory factor